MTEEKKTTTFTTPILITLLVIAAFLAGMFVTKYLGQKETEKQKQEVAQASPSSQEGEILGEELKSAGVGNFVLTGDEICLEDEQPVVYFFGRSTCPHCAWEHPVFEEAVAKFTGLISVHNNMDGSEADSEIWQKYSHISQNSIPFMLLGCRYAQRGSGERLGEEQEEKNITALICKLTEGEPVEVCEEVADLVEQID